MLPGGRATLRANVSFPVTIWHNPTSRTIEIVKFRTNSGRWIPFVARGIPVRGEGSHGPPPLSRLVGMNAPEEVKSPAMSRRAASGINLHPFVKFSLTSFDVREERYVSVFVNKGDSADKKFNL